MKWPVGMILALLVAMFAPLSRGADALAYFKNYFVTGDYTVSGVGLRGKGLLDGASNRYLATGVINVNSVPCTKGVGILAVSVNCAVNGAVPADVIAAFLYWETDETAVPVQNPPLADPASTGYFDGNAIVGKQLGSASNASCWNTENGANPVVFGRTYRADVLRYLKIDSTNSVHLANGAHTVKLPDQGTNNTPGQVIFTNGATLVIVYRFIVPGNPHFATFKSVVIYEGADTVTRNSAQMSQTVGGFYQSTGGTSQMTQIVANGQPGFSITLKGAGDTLSTHPFTGALGGRWDNPTLPIDLDFNNASFSTTASVTTNNACVTWAAIVASTPVVDTDSDGLLDVWETKGMHLNPGAPATANTPPVPATFGACADYPADRCVNLPAMGAKPTKQDIFVQIDWTHGNGDGTGGTDGHGAHVHIPNAQALQMVCSRFGGLLHNIALHFDIGNNYQGQPCILPYKDTKGNVLAQGGSNIDEALLVCPNPIVTSASDCTYSEPYAVLSYKRTFLGVKNGYPLLGIPSHFDHNRKDIFHYSLWSHAIAGPFNLMTGVPLDGPGSPPVSISGVADRPGGDLMITLGLWRSDIPTVDQVGTTQVQGGTLMHELGHNLDLSHAGLYRTPNCMPNYPSVMNYLYQTRGLTDAAGNEQIDFSYGLSFPMSESSLSSNPLSLGILAYRVRYFGPVGPNNTPGQAAQVHCDGTTITDGAQAVRSEGVAANTLLGPIPISPDWSNATQKTPYSRFAFDVNFNGATPENFYDQPDWFSLNLQQVGARPNVDGLSTDIHLGAADLGAADLGAADLGAADLGAADLGAADLGAADLGAADLGAADLGAADLGAADLGAADLGDVDYDTVVLQGVDPPPPPSASCPAPQCGVLATNEIGDVKLQWSPPGVGATTGYNIYRCAVIAPATSCTQPTTPLYTNVSGGTPAPSYLDTVNDFVHAGATCPPTATCYNTKYVYQLTSLATAAGKTVEGPPYSTATSEVTHLFVIANMPASIVYGTPNPTPTFTAYGDVAGSLSAASVTCSYAGTPRNVGNYPITCAGPAQTSATDGVTYNAAYLTNTPGSLSITKRPITVTAAASSKPYDSTLASPATPTITSGSLAYNDTATLTETYDTKMVNPPAHIMTPFWIISDGNGGANYQVGPVTINTGVITVATLTVTAHGVNKAYDGTSAATVTLTDSHFAGDSVTETYASASFANAGPGVNIPVTVTGVSINGGTDAGNYVLAATTLQTTANISAPLIDPTALKLNGDAVLTGSTLRLASDFNQRSSAWLTTQLKVDTGFTTTFQFQITKSNQSDTTIADGFAFVIQADPAGINAIGLPVGGSHLGYLGLANSLAVEFDTFTNSEYGDPGSAHIGIQSVGTGQGGNTPDHRAAAGAARTAPVLAGFADGSVHVATISYNGSTLSVFLDNSATAAISASVPNLGTYLGLTGGNAYVGFTAANGDAREDSDILNWSWQ